MSENTKSDNSELLSELSEQEQEASCAGQSINILSTSNFIIQQTSIQTDAYSNLKLSNGDMSSQKTGYNLSQTTIGYSIASEIPSSMKVGNMLNNFVANFLSGLFS
ncbi:hypothetical protein FACHB389_14680 [Nostoc calcicola FACHB-389]|nr:hypothetical protein [Nostoc calcicola FACHB-3891]MDZ8057482.1 hypothetical protein [Nostoc sp. EkiNYC01]OKH34688.1 hypothetical protein FACHB389_14680 [Nostoc calcicola FACHB-389]